MIGSNSAQPDRKLPISRPSGTEMSTARPKPMQNPLDRGPGVGEQLARLGHLHAGRVGRGRRG